MAVLLLHSPIRYAGYPCRTNWNHRMESSSESQLTRLTVSLSLSLFPLLSSPIIPRLIVRSSAKDDRIPPPIGHPSSSLGMAATMSPFNRDWAVLRASRTIVPARFVPLYSKTRTTLEPATFESRGDEFLVGGKARVAQFNQGRRVLEIFRNESNFSLVYGLEQVWFIWNRVGIEDCRIFLCIFYPSPVFSRFV